MEGNENVDRGLALSLLRGVATLAIVRFFCQKMLRINDRVGSALGRASR
jgi:hypothetical protein